MSAFVVCVVGALILCGLLVFENGRVASEYLRVSDAAENAARLAAQNVVGIREGKPRVDEGAARASALSYLRSQGVTGTVSVTGSGSVEVHAALSVPVRYLLSMGGASGTIRVIRQARSIDG